MNPLPIQFTKMSGAGNTFALICTSNPAWENFERNLKIKRPELAKIVCGKTLGLSVDGLVLLSKGMGDIDYVWDFYNSDGSTAEMCGNAARCAARYCHEYLEKKTRNNFRFLTGAGQVDVVIFENGDVSVQMPPTKWIQRNIELRIHQSNQESFAFVNTGVPHLVQKLHDISMAPSLKEMASEARHHHDVKPDGSNVTFYSVDSEDKIKAVTYERGVEDYTLACGTGAVAAAFAYHSLTGIQSVQVEMPGGNLRVIFIENQTRPLLEGDAIFVGDFTYVAEVFL